MSEIFVSFLFFSFFKFKFKFKFKFLLQRVLKSLSDASEWLYGDGFEATTDELTKKLQELQEIVKPIQFRHAVNFFFFSNRNVILHPLTHYIFHFLGI